MVRRHTALIVVLVFVASAGWADETRDQQRCLGDLYARTGSVSTAQYRSDLTCLKRLARAKPCDASPSPRLAKQIDKLVARDQSRCAGDAAPDFGRRPGTEMASAAADEAATIAKVLLGNGLAVYEIDPRAWEEIGELGERPVQLGLRGDACDRLRRG